MATSVSVAKTNNAEIDGLLGGTRWSGTISYSFPDSPSDYAANYYGNGEPTTAGFASAPFAMQQAVIYAVGLIQSYTNATIQFGGTGSADIMVAQSPAANPTSYAYYPANVPAGGDIWFGTQYDYSQAALGNYYFATALHELGHSFGLKHSQETGGVANVAVPTAHDDSEFTVMSYRSYVGGPLTGYTNESYGFPQTYMANDILALQTLYGANYTTHSENTVYSWSPTTGQEFINGVAQPAPGNGAGGSANRIYETVWDGNGIDTYDFSNYTTNLSVNLNPGASSITSATQIAYLGNGHYAQGNVFNAYLFNNDARSYIDNAIGGSGDDTLIGNAISNSLTGGGGNDTLDGGPGADTLIGGIGNDTYVVDNSGDVVIENANEGTDTVQVAALAAYVLAANVENLTHTGSNDFHGDGNSLNNLLIGGAGNDTLVGGDGSDTLVDGAGVNSLQGGRGDDVYAVQSTGDVVVENANEGTDQVQTFLSNYVLGANVENLTFVDSATHTGTGNELNNLLTGGSGDDYLIGLGGNDVLIDGGGADMLQGGTGDDVYVIQSDNDAVFEGANEGIDQVGTFLAFYRLPANVENLTFVGATSHTGIGNELDNFITGAGGNDTLDGGAGADHLVGGLGNDTYIVDNSGDIVVENAGEGTDTVRTALPSYTLTANVENLTHTGSNDFTGIGNTLDNVLTGGAGIDHLIGGAGNDTYIVDQTDDVVVENANEGTDTVLAWSALYMLSTNVENLTHTAGSNFIGVGNALDNVLTGGADNDYLIGLGGNDLLIDGGGADTLQGGTGNDFYVVQSDGDSVYEYASEGTDEVGTFLAFYHLSANVENLTFVGATSHTGIGNELDNVITGGTGNDYLIGLDGNDLLIDGGGADMLQGGTGNDFYVVQSDGDSVYEYANEGTDEVGTFLASYHLSANVENLTFVGATSHIGTGNELNNVITGAGGNDTLNGLAGSDTLTGAAGSDQFVFSTAIAGGTNVDIITDFTVNVDHIVLDHSIFSAMGTGALAASAFTAGAETANSRIVYDANTGHLSYDADGSGPSAAIQFAVLSAHLNMTSSDFLIV